MKYFDFIAGWFDKTVNGEIQDVKIEIRNKLKVFSSAKVLPKTIDNFLIALQ